MKAKRQFKILEIIKNNHIETQEDLVAKLKEEGFNVTQATVCRDIKELNLIKVLGENNRFKYALPHAHFVYNSNERLKRLFKTSVLNVDYSENLIVIKTLPGEAMGVAAAIDVAGLKEVIGTIGGDDNILVVVKPKEAVKKIVKMFGELAKG